MLRCGVNVASTITRTIDTSRQHIFSVYRIYLREVRRLPHIYLRQFYQIQGSDQFRALLQTNFGDSRCRKLKRILKGLRRLQLANGGDHLAFNRMLDVAYGRVGKLKYELMEPLLSKPGALLPPPIVPGREKSRPPVYTSELSALLTSACSRDNPRRGRVLICPPIVSSRTNPKSEDAFLGPLRKRREANARWRYFSAGWKKVLPPLQVSVEPPSSKEDSGHDVSSPRLFGFEETNLLQQLFDLAGYSHISPPPKGSQCNPTSRLDGKLPARWLRRRYRELLGRLPILTYRRAANEVQEYSVSLPESALTGRRVQVSQLHSLEEEDRVWLADMLDNQRTSVGP